MGWPKAVPPPSCGSPAAGPPSRRASASLPHLWKLVRGFLASARQSQTSGVQDCDPQQTRLGGAGVRGLPHFHQTRKVAWARREERTGTPVGPRAVETPTMPRMPQGPADLLSYEGPCISRCSQAPCDEGQDWLQRCFAHTNGPPEVFVKVCLHIVRKISPLEVPPGCQVHPSTQ